MIDIGSFVAGSSIIAFLLIGVIKKFIKKSIEPRFSDLITQIILLAISGFIAFIGYILNFIPKEIWLIAWNVGKDTIIVYQVFYKAILQKAILGKVDSDEK